MTERIQRLIAASGLMPRRAAEEQISAGHVTVNGLTAHLGDKADPEKDIIMVGGKQLPPTEEKLYIMLHKPKGYVTTMQDEKGRKNVSQLVKGLGARVYPAGRLDMYSEGLLIMTNDGDFANRLTHPSGNLGKTYQVWVRGSDVEEKAEQLKKPIELDGYMTHPAQVEIMRMFEDGAVLSVTIFEGRNRQVRRMCAHAGLKVTKLLRISEGPLRLGELKSGQWRHLTKNEIRQVMDER